MLIQHPLTKERKRLVETLTALAQHVPIIRLHTLCDAAEHYALSSPPPPPSRQPELVPRNGPPAS